MKLKNNLLLLGLIIGLGFLTACNGPSRSLQSLIGTLTAGEVVENSPKGEITPTAFVSPSNREEEFPILTPQQPCAFVWASQPLPEESRKFQELMNEKNLEHVRVAAEAFGENCVGADGEVVRFLTMQTDFRIAVNVRDISRKDEMGNTAAAVLRVIFEIPVSDLPGTQPGYIGIQFTDEQNQILNLWFKRELAEKLLGSGVDGEDLFTALQMK